MKKTSRTLRAPANDPARDDQRDLASLLQQVASKNELAFSKLYAATVRKLRWTVMQVLGKHVDVEDVVQDAYLRIWLGGHRFDPRRSSPITWMTVIARNAAIDRLRGRRRPALPIEQEALSIADQPVDPFEDQDRATEVRIALGAMTRLAPDRAELLSRAYLQGHSRAELARSYATPESTIKTRIRRSLMEVRQHLEAQAETRTGQTDVSLLEAAA